MEKDITTSYKTSQQKISERNTDFSRNINKNKKINQKNTNNEKESHYAVFLNQKIKKLTTALYVVSDFLSDNEPIKWKLREASVNLIGHVGTYNLHSPLSLRLAVERVFLGTAEIISLLEIAFGARLISEMNFAILRSGYADLSRAIQEREESPDSGSVAVPEHFFDEKRSSYSDTIFLDAYRKRRDHLSSVRDFSPASTRNSSEVSPLHAPRTPLLPRSSFGSSNSRVMSIKDISNSEKDIRKNRKDDILKMMSFSTGNGMNIKDISGRFMDVGEKTIQRDLMEMLKEGKVSKQGERRWSTYSVVKK